MFKLIIAFIVINILTTLLVSVWMTVISISILIIYSVSDTKTQRYLWIIFSRDIPAILKLARLELYIKKVVYNNTTIGDLLVNNAKNFPDKVAYKSADNGEKLTFQEANELSNKIANTFLKAGFKKGDVVSLLMENRIEYVPIWIGLSKVGIISSLINTNLQADGLKHCLNVSNSKALIYTESFQMLTEHLKENEIELYCFSNENIKSSQPLLKRMESESCLEPPNQNINILDKLLYIFTSGTTGFPKAAVIRGIRFAYMGYGNGFICDYTKDDIGYSVLPLYHTTSGVGLIGGCLFFGCTVVIRKKLSASKFFQECCKYNCTTFNYIGEVCSYILAQPPSEFDQKHSIRVCSGAGMRGSIWKDFQKRFKIRRICELYGATEGNATMANLYGTPAGSCGFTPLLIPNIIPIKLCKIDAITGEILRDTDGKVVEAEIGEPGELVGKIRSDATRQFDGYVNKEATKKKIVYDIFSKGDSAFRTGDILIKDEDSYFYFQDRTGDTFRWKGENVSTNEVEGVISKCVNLSEVCVYGVKIPEVEGKAGMACIVDPDRKVALKELYKKMLLSLPSFAIPIFIRFTSQIEKTGSFKFKKNKLRQQAFNPKDCSGDDLFYFNKINKKYQLLNEVVYNDIMQNKNYSF